MRLRREVWPEHLQPVKKVDGMISAAEAGLLYDLARQATEGAIVEVGSYRGRSTVALALGTVAGHNLPVFAVDPHEPFVGVKGGKFGPQDRAAFYRTMLDTGCYEQVRLLNASSEVVTPGWRTPVSLLWVDGDHRFEGVRRDVECWQPHLTDGAVVIFDDVEDPAGGPNQYAGAMIDMGVAETLAEVGKVLALRLAPRITAR